VYAAPKAVSKVDFYFELCEMPRIFEWNLMNHPHIQRSCLDIDGVLCRDPRPEEDDDGSNYERFLATVEPLIVPTVEIGWLVTCRLEKYRDLTADWLAKHGIRYKNLVMMNYSTKAERMAAGRHADFKAKIYTDTEAVLFVESSCRQAAEISKRTGKYVFCMETREMVAPDNWAKARRLVYDQSSWGRLRLRRIFRLGKRKVSSPAFE
jgi:orotate phosphoribosyltransferase